MPAPSTVDSPSSDFQGITWQKLRKKEPALRFNSRDALLADPGLRSFVDQAGRVRAAPLDSTASWSARRNNSKYLFSAFGLGFAGVYLSGLVVAGALG
ncbi:hypothetical protein [Stutzerimonas stutzeri]|uniref:hypothetical protein n=1 Tax=Stutzerimonas stutzeri TaxID=316 RepID=UPI00210B7193|nr:hypothetical protein [Stutzerimonas stutzeri]MCQ4321028.1 hypothetical protein [Stutzerimonas stutzeri]